jgi:hypothetical protein
MVAGNALCFVLSIAGIKWLVPPPTQIRMQIVHWNEIGWILKVLQTFAQEAMFSNFKFRLFPSPQNESFSLWMSIFMEVQEYVHFPNQLCYEWVLFLISWAVSFSTLLPVWISAAYLYRRSVLPKWPPGFCWGLRWLNCVFTCTLSSLFAWHGYTECIQGNVSQSIHVCFILRAAQWILMQFDVSNPYKML